MRRRGYGEGDAVVETNRKTGSAWRAIDFQTKARFLLHERFKLRLQPAGTRHKHAARRVGAGFGGRQGGLDLRPEATDACLHLAFPCYQEITRDHR